MTIPVDLRDIDHYDRQAVLRRCYLTLLNAGGEDGDWMEITSEIAAHNDEMWDVLPEYFDADRPDEACFHGFDSGEVAR